MGPYVVTHQSDITRFGRRVISTRFENDAAAASNEAMFNVALPCTMEDGSILPCIFSDERVPRLTWSIIDVVLQGDFARLCFQKMTSDHLGRMQDSYEMFVLCACARRFETITDFQGLHYNLVTVALVILKKPLNSLSPCSCQPSSSIIILRNLPIRRIPWLLSNVRSG